MLQVGDSFVAPRVDQQALRVQTWQRLGVSHAWLDVLFVVLQSQTHQYGRVELRPLMAANSPIRHVAVFSVFQHTVTFWGYAECAKLVRDLVSASGLTSVLLNRYRCSKTAPRYTAPELLQQPLTLHPRYNGYTSVLGDLARGEMGIRQLEDAVGTRMLMYDGDFHLDADRVYVATEEALREDQAAYHMILSVLRDQAFTYRYQGVTMHKLMQEWRRREMVLTKFRTEMSTEEVVATQLLGVSMQPTLPYERAFSFVGEADNEYVCIPFEDAPPRLIAQRRIRLVRGNAVIGRRYIKETANAVLSRVHERNWQANQGIPLHMRTANVQPLAIRIARYFFEVCPVADVSLTKVPSVKLLPGQVMQYAPMCMQTLYRRSVENEEEDATKPGLHNKFSERSALSRYLVEFGWTADNIYSVWEAKMERIYLSRRDKLRTIQRQLSGTAKKAQRERIGPTCASLARTNLCPCPDRHACIADFLKRLQQQPLPATLFQTPAWFTRHLVAAANNGVAVPPRANADAGNGDASVRQHVAVADGAVQAGAAGAAGAVAPVHEQVQGAAGGTQGVQSGAR